MRKTFEAYVILVFLLNGLFVVGCSNSVSRVYPPEYSSDAGNNAVADFDIDGDSLLDAAELEKVPGLLACLSAVDTDKDKKISQQEVDLRVDSWIKSRVGEMPVSCQFLLDGEPIEGALVEFIPESFLGERVPSGTGTTNEHGETVVSMAPERLADPNYGGMACGFFRVHVRKEGIPAKYNDETILGCEVGMNAAWVASGKVTFKLESD